MRCAHKGHEALRSANPYTAAVVAYAESFIFSHENLCYITEASENLRKEVRILHLQSRVSTETVLSIADVLNEAIVPAERSTNPRFRLLHFSAGILSCLYSERGSDKHSWLICVDVSQSRLLTSRRLDSHYLIFVRNDANYLYFGTHTDLTADRRRRWVLKGFNIAELRWIEQKIHLLDFVGFDIGVSVVFEVIDGSFYAISNQTDHLMNTSEWISYYYSVRFTMGNTSVEDIETSDRPFLWRRDHLEGPIDERWLMLELFKDSSGTLKILEGRKEWPEAGRNWRRSYYTTNLVFPPKTSPSQDGFGNLAHESSGSGCGPTVSDLSRKPAPDARLVTSSADTRCPYGTHLGDSPYTALPYTLSKTPIRSYHPRCETFLDLVEESTPGAPCSAMELRIRCGSRKRLPLATADEHATTAQRIEKLYRDKGANTVALWPPAKSSGHPQESLDELYSILNPTGERGEVRGVVNGNSLVYSISTDQMALSPIVLVSFDPSLQLVDVKSWQTRDRATSGKQRRTSDAVAANTCTSWPDRKRKRGSSLTRVEKARCRSISKGYSFAL